MQVIEQRNRRMNNEIASDHRAEALHDAGGPAASEKYFEDWLILTTTSAA